jgi:hypothetical protein
MIHATVETPGIDYEKLVQEAYRSVVRSALRQVSEEGIPGDHHFYLSFQTHALGVAVPPFLAERFPEEITIVLQNQFWNLEVEQDGFAVDLAFDGRRYRLEVPFAALTTFADPSAPFGIRFPPAGEEGEAESDTDASPAFEPPEGEAGANVVSFDRFRKDRG